MADVPTEPQLSNAAEPLVSFVIPTYNEATHPRDPPSDPRPRLGDFLRDDRRRRRQRGRYPRYRGAFGAIVVDQEGSGIGAARHQGTERARGEFYAFVDADTLLDPTYLDEMVSYVREESLVAASSHCELRGPRRAAVPPVGSQRALSPVGSADPAGVQHLRSPRGLHGGGLPEPPERGRGPQPSPRRRRGDGLPSRRSRCAFRAARRRPGPLRNDPTLPRTRRTGYLP